MDNHFVEGHLGGYYISNSDPEVIEEYCDECGDYDRIMFSYDEEDKKEPFKSLSKYLTKDLIFSKRKLKKALIDQEAKDIGIKRAILEIKHNIVFDIDTNKDIVISLLETNDIDKKTCDRLIAYLDKMLKKQMEYIDNFDYSKMNLLENVKIKKR